MAGLSVQITAGTDQGSSSVSASGTVSHIITDAERTAFKIEDAGLKAAIATYFGQAPDDAYVCSPTPWGDLYATYGWSQVLTTLTAQSATVTGVTSNPTTMATKTLTNNSNVAATFEAAISDEVSNTTEESWSTTDSVEVSQSISYEIGFLGTGGGGETSLSYTHAWEHGGSESETFTMGSTQGVTVELQPGQKVEAQLGASRGVMTVDIVWQASLAGATAINYGDTYKDHHFWGLDIAGVMQAGQLANSITWTETITIDYFSNAQVTLNNLQGAPVAVAL